MNVYDEIRGALNEVPNEIIREISEYADCTAVQTYQDTVVVKHAGSIYYIKSIDSVCYVMKNDTRLFPGDLFTIGHLNDQMCLFIAHTYQDVTLVSVVNLHTGRKLSTFKIAALISMNFGKHFVYQGATSGIIHFNYQFAQIARVVIHPAGMLVYAGDHQIIFRSSLGLSIYDYSARHIKFIKCFVTSVAYKDGQLCGRYVDLYYPINFH
jgi:hypothetical protein